MEYRAFGRTGLRVSAMGFGSWPMSGDRYGPIEDEEAIRAVRRALDVGVTCFDTAPGYGAGHSEAVLGRALDTRRNDVVLVTKCGIFIPPGSKTAERDGSRANVLREVDESLRRIGTDVIDVYLVHWPDPKVPVEETFAAVDEVVRAGKARFAGVSNFTVEQMQRCMTVRPIDVIQVGYHLFDRRMEREVFPFCAEQGIGVMGYGSLAHGLLTGAFTAETTFDEMDWRFRGVAFGQPILKGDNLRLNVAVVERLKREVAEPRGVPISQVALAWALHNPVVSTALVGARTPAEVDQNVAGAELRLSDDEVARIASIMADAAGTITAFTPLRIPVEEWE